MDHPAENHAQSRHKKKGNEADLGDWLEDVAPSKNKNSHGKSDAQAQGEPDLRDWLEDVVPQPRYRKVFRSGLLGLYQSIAFVVYATTTFSNSSIEK